MTKKTKDHLNSYGLINGDIPKGVACPFLKQCVWVDDHCPTEGHPKLCRYSCGAARTLSLAKCKEANAEDNL